MPHSHLAEEKVKVEVAALAAQSCGGARQRRHKKSTVSSDRISSGEAEGEKFKVGM